MFFFFFKQKTAYDMRISDWSSDVCSSDLICRLGNLVQHSRDSLAIKVPHRDGPHFLERQRFAVLKGDFVTGKTHITRNGRRGGARGGHGFDQTASRRGRDRGNQQERTTESSEERVGGQEVRGSRELRWA